MAKQNFTSPVGRMVQGSTHEPQMTDQQGNPRVVQNGPNKGQPSPQWFIGVAFAKNDPNWPAFYQILYEAARTGFPHLFPTPGGPCTLPTFSFKVIDGDGVDTTGKPWSAREGFAGHWVVRFSSGFAPKCYHAGRYAPADEIHDKNVIKCGYFVRVAGTVEGNDNAQKPGIYVNLSMVELCGYGPEIVSGPDAASTFGQAGAPVLPPGASAMPVAAGPMPTPAVGAAPYAPPPAPVATPAPAAVQGSYTGYMAAPPPAPPAPIAPPPPGPIMTAAAGANTYDQYIAAGWNHGQLVTAGLVVA